MKRFFSFLGQLIIAPFKFLWRLIMSPFRFLWRMIIALCRFIKRLFASLFGFLKKLFAALFRFLKRLFIVLLLITTVYFIVKLVCALDFSAISKSNLSSSVSFYEAKINLSNHSLNDIYEMVQDPDMVFFDSHIRDLFSEKLLSYSVDDLLNMVSKYPKKGFNDIVIHVLETKAIEEGPISISKVYQSGIDKEWYIIVEMWVIELLSDFSNAELHELLPYYYDSDYYDQIAYTLSSNLSGELDDLRMECIGEIMMTVDSVMPSVISSSISEVYESFFGGFFDYNNYRYNVFSSKDNTNYKFSEIWEEKINQSHLGNFFYRKMADPLEYYVIKRDSILHEIGEEQSIDIPTKIPKFSYNYDVMRNTVERNYRRGVKDGTLTSIGLVTAPVGGWMGGLLFVGDFTLDFGLESMSMFESPEEYFKHNQLQYVYNQIVNYVNNFDISLKSNDERIIKRVVYGY